MSDTEMVRLYELISLYVDGTLDAAQQVELARLLDNSAYAAEFLELTRMDREIAGLYAGPVSDQQLSRQVLRDIRQRKENSSSRTSAIMEHVRVRRAKPARKSASAGAWLWAIGAAAAIFIALLVAKNFTASTPATPAALATLVSASEATVLRDGKNVAITTGTPLLPKDVVSTGTGGAASLCYADGTQLDLRGESSASVETDPSGHASKMISLAKGSLFATVAAQPPGHPLIVRSDIAEAVVIGTQFSFSSETDSARLDVLEGKVHFTRRSDTTSVDISGGNYAVAKNGVTLAAAPIQPAAPPASVAAGKPEPLPPGATVLYQDVFSTQPGPAWFGAWEKTPVKGLRELALHARPIEDRSGTGTFFCDLRSPKIPAGFTVGKHTYLRFRVLPVKFTPNQVIKVMFKRADEMNYGAYILAPVPDQWQTFTVRLDSKIYFMDDFKKKLQPGEVIEWLIWEGLSVKGAPPPGATLWLEDPVVFEALGEIPGAISFQDSAD